VAVLRRRARVDINQKEITEALRAAGASVHPTHMVGKGFPDLTVGWRGINYFMELKDGNAPLSQQKLTKEEAEWHSKWRGTIFIVKSVREALEVIGAV
jgi:hypothetical protein